MATVGIYYNIRTKETYKKAKETEDHFILQGDTGVLTLVAKNDVQLWFKYNGTVELSEAEELEMTEKLVELDSMEASYNSVQAALDSLLDVTQYEGKAKKNIENLDDSGLALITTALTLGYSIEVSNTYIGIKNDQNKLVARLIPIKKGNRLYTFEKKVEAILPTYSNGEITCLGKPGIGNTNTYVTLSLLDETKRQHILKTLDPAA